MNKVYRLGDTEFLTKEAKERWILQMVLRDVEYLGKETKLSPTERELRRLAIRDLKKIIKTKQG